MENERSKYYLVAAFRIDGLEDRLLMDTNSYTSDRSRLMDMNKLLRIDDIGDCIYKF